jgi:GH25 family lysozyme M1 (1,4-beta-N-acetylmuramidase)
VTARGVDVSSFQGPPAAWRGAAGAIEWAAVKFTELSHAGPYANPLAAADWAWLKSQGKGRIAYMFGHPAASPALSVGLFAAQLVLCGLEDSDAVCLDHEVQDDRSTGEVAAWGRTVLALLHQRLSRMPLLYCNRNMAEIGACEGMGGYPLWIADPSSPPGQPRVPAPWKTWAIHQHDISGPIDRDVAVWATREQMARQLGKPATHPKEPPVRDLGGKLGGLAVASARWGNGVIVVAGVDPDGRRVVVNRCVKGTWCGWKDTGAGPAKSAPAIVTWEHLTARHGRLYYTSDDGHVRELATSDDGKTWT